MSQRMRFRNISKIISCFAGYCKMPQEEEIMAIKVSENGRLFTLQTKDSSYQMFADDKNVLLHLYYGEKIGEENLSGLFS